MKDWSRIALDSGSMEIIWGVVPLGIFHSSPPQAGANT